MFDLVPRSSKSWKNDRLLFLVASPSKIPSHFIFHFFPPSSIVFLSQRPHYIHLLFTFVSSISWLIYRTFIPSDIYLIQNPSWQWHVRWRSYWLSQQSSILHKLAISGTPMSNLNRLSTTLLQWRKVNKQRIPCVAGLTRPSFIGWVGEHHILNLAAAPEPAFQSSVTIPKAEASTSKKEHPSSVIATQPTHVVSLNPKPSTQFSKPSPSSKDSKPLVTTSPASAKPAASPKGPDASPSSTLLPSSSVDRSMPSSSNSVSTLPSSPSSNDTSGSSSGAVAGIVIAVIAIVGAITAFVMIRRKKRTTPRNPDPFTMGFGSHDPPPATYMPPPPPETTYNAQPYYQDPVQMSPISPAYAPPVMASYAPPAQEMSGSLGVFNVVSVYTPTLSDEIDIQLGDHIELLVEYDDGWCQGVNLSRGNAKGVFPRHCVEQYPGQHYDGPVMNRVSSMYMA